MKLRHFFRKAAGVVLSAVLLVANSITVYAKPDWPADVGILADAGIVMDMDSGAVIFGQQIHTQLPPASITKLLTALVVAEHTSMDETVTFSHDAVYNVESGSGNKLSLEEGDELSVEDCLYALLLISSNQSANALAEHVAGSRNAFVEMMNQKIEELGCKESHFANPSGLNDENQYVSAYDMALIATAAFHNETVLAVSSSKSHKIQSTINNPDGISFKMEHRILMADADNPDYYCEGATAGKTGYTSIAGNTLVTYAARDGQNLVSVILKGTQPQYYADARALLEFGFASVKNVNISEQETLLKESGELPIGEKSYQTSDLSIEENAVITIPKDAAFTDANREILLDLSKDAPAGAVAYLQYYYNDRKIGGAYLISASLKDSIQTAGDGIAETTGQTADENGAAADEPSVPASDETPKKPGIAKAELMKIVIPVCALVVIGGAATAGFLFIRRRKEQEAAEAAARKARRIQRLKEIGYSEEDFEKLLNERKQNIGTGKKGQ